jgi:hypothetical protein
MLTSPTLDTLGTATAIASPAPTRVALGIFTPIASTLEYWVAARHPFNYLVEVNFTGQVESKKMAVGELKKEMYSNSRRSSVEAWWSGALPLCVANGNYNCARQSILAQPGLPTLHCLCEGV